jgi:hypothetical protein
MERTRLSCAFRGGKWRMANSDQGTSIALAAIDTTIEYMA